MIIDILVLGGYCLDLIFTDLEGQPELGKEVFSRKFAMLPGGTYNVAAALHRLGVKTAWAAIFGNDDFSHFVLEKTRGEGLDPRYFTHLDKPYRNITVASSYQGDREFISFSDPEPFKPAYFRNVLETECRAVFIGGLYTSRLLPFAARHFKKRKSLLVMDGNSSHGTLKDPATEQALKWVDIFLPNAREARRLTGRNDLVQCLRVLGGLTKTVVIKNGPEGSIAIQNGKISQVPGIPVKCVDTTGAGDCFDAGFMKAYLSGEDLTTCLRWGNIVGGLSTQGCGGTSFYVGLSEVQKAIRKHYRKTSTKVD